MKLPTTNIFINALALEIVYNAKKLDAPRDFFDIALLPLDFLNRPYFNRLLLHIYILLKVAKCVLKIKGEPILSKYVLVHGRVEQGKEEE